MESATPISGFTAYPNDGLLMGPEGAWKLFCFGSTPGGSGRRSKRTFKLSEKNLPFEPHLVLCDIKMAMKFGEDAVFESSPSVMYNMRRGLSYLMTDIGARKREVIAQAPNPVQELKKQVVAREQDRKLKPKKKGRRNVEAEEDEIGAEVEEAGLPLGKNPWMLEEEETKGEPEEEKEVKPRSTLTETEKPLMAERKPLAKPEPSQPSTEEEKKKEPPPSPKGKLPSPAPKKSGPLFLVSRKGLRKFFDIDPACFEPDFHLPRRDNKINYLLGPVERNLAAGIRVEVFATRKANGENAQVSYLPQVGLWGIASKNVSICARTEADLPSFARYCIMI